MVVGLSSEVRQLAGISSQPLICTQLMMEQLVDRISHLQVSHLGTREFQAAVLGALGELMKEQESLRMTLDLLARADENDQDMEELERLISDDSSNDEADVRGIYTISKHGE